MLIIAFIDILADFLKCNALFFGRSKIQNHLTKWFEGNVFILVKLQGEHDFHALSTFGKVEGFLNLIDSKPVRYESG